jgi:hypothetical protein
MVAQLPAGVEDNAVAILCGSLQESVWRKNRGVSAEEVARHIEQGPVTMHTPQT